jgi:hypothetical protein
MLSNHISDRNTSTPSSFSSSYLDSFADVLRLTFEGPPKVFTFPKYALEIKSRE